MGNKKAEDFILRDKSLSENWVPVFLPKELVAKLIREYIPKKVQRSLATMSKSEIMDRLHEVRRELLIGNPSAYIDYNS